MTRTSRLRALTLIGALMILTAPAAFAACGDATTFCANNNRFLVRATFLTPAGQSGSGQAVALTGDTGYFWFFSAGNVELVVKVVDGRAVNNRFWVFAGGLTNVNVVVTITDTVTGAVKTYTNPQGVAFQPIQDTSAFSARAQDDNGIVPTGDSSAGAAGAVSPEPYDLSESPVALGRPAGARDVGNCTADATTLCMNGGRFQIRTQYTTRQGQTGAGQAVPLTGDTGYFWFFSAGNVEMVVKALNACTFNSRFWLFAGGLTDVNVVMTVTDTFTGAVKTYANPQGTAFQPIQDASAFATCDAQQPPGPCYADFFAGNWAGQWVNNTSGNRGSAGLSITVDTSAKTFQATLSLGGNIFGLGTPPPQTFSGPYACYPGTFNPSTPLFGNIVVTFNPGGFFFGRATNLPTQSISRLDFTGSGNAEEIHITLTITFPDGHTNLVQLDLSYQH